MSEPSSSASFRAGAQAVPPKTLFLRLRHGTPDVVGRQACCVCGAHHVEAIESILIGALRNRRYVRAGLCAVCGSERARAARRRAFGLALVVSATFTIAWLALAVTGAPDASDLVPAVLLATVVAGGPFVAATPAFPGAHWRTEDLDVVIELPTRAVIALAPELMPHLPPHQAAHVAMICTARSSTPQYAA